MLGCTAAMRSRPATLLSRKVMGVVYVTAAVNLLFALLLISSFKSAVRSRFKSGADDLLLYILKSLRSIMLSSFLGLGTSLIGYSCLFNNARLRLVLSGGGAVIASSF